MTTVLIVYVTSLGNTRRMAEATADGARSIKDTEVVLKQAHEASKDDVRTCDALILGSPMRHRTADSRIKAFIEEVCEQLWLTDEIVGGVFTVGGGYGDCGAGCELAQLGQHCLNPQNAAMLTNRQLDTLNCGISNLDALHLKNENFGYR